MANPAPVLLGTGKDMDARNKVTYGISKWELVFDDATDLIVVPAVSNHRTGITGMWLAPADDYVLTLKMGSGSLPLNYFASEGPVFRHGSPLIFTEANQDLIFNVACASQVKIWISVVQWPTNHMIPDFEN